MTLLAVLNSIIKPVINDGGDTARYIERAGRRQKVSLHLQSATQWIMQIWRHAVVL